MIVPIPKYFTFDDLKISGIYFIMYRGAVVYIGQSRDVFTRVRSSVRDVTKFDSIRIIQCEPEMLLKYEERWIIRFRPKHNNRHLYQWRGSNLYGPRRRYAINKKSKLQSK